MRVSFSGDLVKKGVLVVAGSVILIALLSLGLALLNPPAQDASDIPAGITNASLDIKTRFVRGMEITVDPRSIRITGVEELPNRSFIVYLAVPDAGTIRQAAVYGQCVDPGDLGYGGGFIEGPNDPELEGQRAAAESTACP